MSGITRLPSFFAGLRFFFPHLAAAASLPISAALLVYHRETLGNLCFAAAPSHGNRSGIFAGHSPRAYHNP